MDNSAEMTAIVGATVIDGNGGTPIHDSVILVKDERIVAVGDTSLEIPKQASRIPASGKFAVPGLMTACSYLTDCVSTTMLIRYEGRYDEVAIEAAQLTLKGGVTTVFDGWGPRDALIKARDRINQGHVPASRIYLAGYMVGVDGPFSRGMVPQYRVAVPEPFAARVDSIFQLNIGQVLTRLAPERVREEVRNYVNSGIDFLTYSLVDHLAFEFIAFSPRVQRLIVEEAHRAKLPVLGGAVTTGEALALGLDAGLDIVTVSTHLPLSLTNETLELVAKRRMPFTCRFETAETVEWYRSRGNTASLAYVEAGLATSRQLLGASAVPLLAAPGKVSTEDELTVQTAASPPVRGYGVLGDSHFYQLLAMRDFGMTPMDVLMAATKNVAVAYHVDKDLGTLERGKIADLVVLDGNPLADVEHYRSIHLVMKGGRIIDREALPTQRLITAPRQA
jgi:imidazolonepropionase-like amidohydrolase